MTTARHLLRHWVWLWGLALLLITTGANAASLRTQVSARRIGVGERLTVRVTCVQADGDPDPESPELVVKGKAQIQGPSIGSQQSMSMNNFSVTRESSVIATWSVVPSAEGKLVIGPGTFHVGNQILRGETIEVEVVATPTARRQVSPFDPFGFDPFGGAPQFAAPRDLTLRDFGPPEAPERLQLQTAPNPVAFLRTLPSKRKLVVGEAFTVEVWVYASRGAFREANPTEPLTADFLSYMVLEHAHEEPAYATTIGDQRWLVVKLRELILVPLRTGKTSIGGMETVLVGPGYPSRGSRLGSKLKSPNLELDIVEPPLDGRPDGYLLGDVGRYQLSATLNPRQLRAGEYAELRVTVAGVGNLPSRVILPSLAGVEWQEPALSGGPAVKDGKLQGVRTLKVPLLLKEAGHIELGAVRLPFYDAAARAYREASVELGAIDVEPSPFSKKATPPPAAPDKPSERHFEARTVLGSSAPPRPPALTLRAWALLFVPPLLTLLGAWTRRLTQHLHARRLARRSATPSAKDSLSAARKSAERGDLPATLRELERALYDGLERISGLKGRGVLRQHLAQAAQDAGLSADLAGKIGSAALALEALRYESPAPSARDVLAAWSSVVEELARKKAKKGGPS